MEIKKQPYELQARWNENGQMQGATVQYCIRIFENGKQISVSITDPQPLHIGIDEGFPVTDILDEINIQSLQNVLILRDEISSLKVERDNYKTEKDILDADKNALITEKESLIQNIAAKESEISILKQRISELEALNNTAKEESNPLPLTKEDIK